MSEPLEPEEIEALIARTQAIRNRWHGNPGYARTLDIELRALRLLLTMTIIARDSGEDEMTMGLDAEDRHVT